MYIAIRKKQLDTVTQNCYKRDMTTNAYLFMWNSHGIESIVPITQYEDQHKLDMWNILKDGTRKKNPLDEIIMGMKLRAQFNTVRSYEIYAMDCDEGITKEDLFDFWNTSPQAAADLTRERGVKILSDRNKERPHLIR
jgi:hypothetical protein